VILPETFANQIAPQSDVLRVSYEPTPARHAIYFSQLFDNLVSVDISHNSLTKLDADFRHQRRLTYFNAGFNQIETLESCLFPESLEVLLMHQNKLSTVPSHLGKHRKVKTLNLACNRLKRLPPVRLDGVRVLYANRNPQLDPTDLRAFLQSLRQMTVLELKDTCLRELFAEICCLSNLKKLHLSRNELHSLPPEIGQQGALQVLDVSRNRLTRLPPEIGSLTALQELYVGYQTSLHGAPKDGSDPFFPDLLEGGGLGSLRLLACQNNGIKSVPAWVCNLKSLEELDLRGTR
jgi:leucine-rich repeat protein SHOC2